jgi:hypothetical protein
LGQLYREAPKGGLIMEDNVWKEVMREMGLRIFDSFALATAQHKKLRWYQFKSRWQLEGMMSVLHALGVLFKETWMQFDLNEQPDIAKGPSDADDKA